MRLGPRVHRYATFRDLVIDVVPGEKLLTVVTAGNTKLDCDLVVLAPGHTRARLPAAFKPDFARHARVIVDPLGAPRLPAVPSTERVLVLGSGLTAYDIIFVADRSGSSWTDRCCFAQGAAAKTAATTRAGRNSAAMAGTCCRPA